MAISSNDTNTNDTGARRPAPRRQIPPMVSYREKMSRFFERWGSTLLTIVEWLAFTAVAIGFVLLLFALIAG